MKKKRFQFTYTQMMAFGFLLIVLVGTLLLLLPASSASGKSAGLLTSLFTATSATCVTGLSVVETASFWSPFGQVVLLVLIQVGGLGLMTMMTMFSIFARRRIGLTERRLLMQSTGTMRLDGVISLIKHIVQGTFVFELLGAGLLAIRFIPQFGFAKGLWFSVFHAVSAYCNAGFDLLGSTSFTEYVSDPLVCTTLMMLIVSGGLGFIVYSDLLRKGFHFSRYGLHTKLVLISTFSLLLVGTVLFYLTERNAAFTSLNEGQKWLAAVFQSVTTRTAGFASVDQSSLSNSGSMLTMALMLVGGSPGSTAGGIKTTTIAVFLLSTLAASRNQSEVVVFKRKLDPVLVHQANAIVAVYLLMTLFSAMLIAAVEPFGFRDVLFETCSAIGTVGLSTGVTPLFGNLPRVILVVLMFAGRIGGLSLVLAVAEKREWIPLQHPVEKIMVG